MAAWEAEATAAARIATDAGALLCTMRSHASADSTSLEGLKAAGDAAAHRFIVDRLAAEFPADRVLSEEATAARERTDVNRGMGRVWIVDPLDGTREYGEPPRTDWAVHVALVVDSAPVAGAVALPARQLTLSSADVAPAPTTPGVRPRIVVSRSRPAPSAQGLADHLGGDLVPLGSAGAKAMAIVLGEADVYAHSGGQYEWDSAAPVAVALAAGLHVSRWDGSALRYDNPDPWLPDLVICRADLADEVLHYCREAIR